MLYFLGLVGRYPDIIYTCSLDWLLVASSVFSTFVFCFCCFPCCSLFITRHISVPLGDKFFRFQGAHKNCCPVLSNADLERALHLRLRNRLFFLSQAYFASPFTPLRGEKRK